MISVALAGAALQLFSIDSGLDVLRACRDENYQMFCNGYLRGLNDGLGLSAAVHNTSKLYCLPVSMTLDEQRLVVIDDLEKRRDLWAQNGIAATVLVLQTAFPCGTIDGPPTSDASPNARGR